MSDTGDSRLFPSNSKKKANLFGKDKKAKLFGNVSKKVNLFSEGELEEAIAFENAKRSQDEAKIKTIISGQPKHPVFKLYNDADELIFVTIAPQFQSIMAKEWYFITPPTKITVQYFHTRDEQITAKLRSIQNENPKYNSNNIAR